jgi:iron complex outermembrane receptor protein
MSINLGTRACLRAALAAILAGAGATAAVAAGDDTAASTAGANATGGGLEEIVVTARRREEDLQEVPISITAITGDQLTQRGIETQENLNRMVPNLVIHGSNGFFGLQEGGFQIRGIGNVTIYYDGIAHPETFGIPLGNILEVDHVEVLRGPQGTLFGKDTMGGAIQYVTKAPSDTLGARIKLTTGAFNRYDMTAAVDLPLTDTLLTKVTVAKLSRDGYLQSVTAPMVYGSQDDTLANVDILWKPTAKFSWRVGASWEDDKNNGNPITDWAINTGTPGAANPCATTHPAGKTAPDLTCLYNAIGLTIPQTWAFGATQQWKTASNYQGPDLYTQISGITNTMIYEFSDQWVGKILGGYRKVKNFDYTDFDATEWNIFEGKNYNEQDEGTLEAQLQFNGTRWSGTNGLYTYTDDRRAHRMNWFQNDLKLAVNPANNAAAIAWLTSNINPLTGLAYPTFSDAAGGPVGGNAAGNGNINSLQYNYSHGYALFTDWTFKVTDKLSLNAGVRYNRDSVDVRNFVPLYPLPVVCCEPIPSVATNGAGPSGAVVDGTFSNTAPKGTITYQWTKDIMTYASYSEGFNRGGATPTNTVPIVLIPYKPETLNDYELGMRSEWLDHRLRFNIGFFYGDYNDLQVSQDVNKINVTRNAGKAVTKGVEIDGYWSLFDHLMFDYSYGYNSAQVTALAPGVTANITVGQTLAYAPTNSASGGLAYEVPLPHASHAIARLDYGWQSSAWTTNDFTNRVLIPAYGIMNGRVTWQSAQDKWEVALFATNLLNQYYRINGYLVPNLYNDVGTPGRPREWGLTISTKF